jgi:hypothetical protein
MGRTCGECKYLNDLKVNGQKPSPGTVWCQQRAIQMAKNRQMSCFVPMVSQKIKDCVDCKRPRITIPSGESPQLGKIGCDKKKTEINKQRTMECFE